MQEISKEKLEWLKSIGAVDIKKFDYMVVSNGHLYSLEHLKNKSLGELKEEYQTLYANRRNNKFFCHISNKRDR